MSTQTYQEPAYREPTYSHWLRPRSPGIFGQGLIGSVLLIGGIIACITLTAFAGLLVGAVAAGVLLGVFAPVLVRVGDRTGGQVLLARLAWARGVRRRQHLYRSGALGLIPGGTHRLPGLLAAVEGYEFTTAGGQSFAVLHNKAAGTWTAQIRCAPEGSDLVDEEVLDQRVAGWAKFQSDAARTEGLDSVAQVVETVPDQGMRLRAEVTRLLHPDAPGPAREALTEAAELMPQGQAVLLSRCAVSWRTTPAAARRKGEARAVAMAELIASYLPGLCASLAAAGAGLCRPMGLAELAEETRMAYDPAAAAAIERARVEHTPAGVSWEDCGPAGAVESFTAYRHDSARSVTWAMTAPPQGQVFRSALVDLLRADPAVRRKRVTIVYRPHRPREAREIAKRDIRTAIFHASKTAHGDAHDDLELQAARGTQEELAQGAALTRFCMYVTATVADGDDLEQAAGNVEQAAGACDVVLRRCYAHQSAAFAAGLGLGVVLPHHVRVPAFVRENV